MLVDPAVRAFEEAQRIGARLTLEPPGQIRHGGLGGRSGQIGGERSGLRRRIVGGQPRLPGLQERDIVRGRAGLHRELDGQTQVPGLVREAQPHDPIAHQVQALESERWRRVDSEGEVQFPQGPAGAGPQPHRLGAEPYRLAVLVGRLVLDIDKQFKPPGLLGYQGSAGDRSSTAKRKFRYQSGETGNRPRIPDSRRTADARYCPLYSC